MGIILTSNRWACHAAAFLGPRINRWLKKRYGDLVEHAASSASR
jgi:hypothetical protein